MFADMPVPSSHTTARGLPSSHTRRIMGLFWDLYQQSQITQHSERQATVEVRLERVEQEVNRLSTLLREVIGRLEKHVGVDLDSDGRVG